MKKIKVPALLALITGLAALTGCDDSGYSNSSIDHATQGFTEGTAPRFNPAILDLPFNTDLIFAAAATSDGTADTGSPTDPVRSALNVMDGFSTSAYFDVLINGSVDPTTAIASQTVFLVQLNTGSNDALNPANVTGIVGAAAFDVQILSLDGGRNNSIRLRPLRPLAARSKYLVFITNDVKDTAGNALTRSIPYSILRDPTREAAANLLPVRTAITGWETLASSFLASGGQLTAAAAREKLVLTYTFTTTDPLTPLLSMAAPRAALAQTQINAGVSPATAIANVTNLDNAGLLPTPRARPVGIAGLTGIDFGVLSSQLASNIGKLYTGYIKLPYYQTSATGLPFGEYLKRNWRPDSTLASALGTTLPADVDGTFNLTYRYPFATKNADETVPLQVTLPSNTFVPGYAGAATCGQIYGATGYPVAMYVHGITSDRTSILALAHTLASRCVATVAIDLPLHGIPANSPFVNALNVERSQLIPFATVYGANAPHERHYNVAGPAGSPAPMNFGNPGTSDGSGAQFINLGYLANTRDNNRQGVVDLLNLNASLGNVNAQILSSVTVGLDLNRLYVVGISLGGILGQAFVTTNQLAIANDAHMGLVSNLNPIRGLVLASAGSQVAQIIINSPTFGPVINASLTASNAAPGTSAYERFSYVAQSLLDSADAVSFAEPAAALGVPILLQQIRNDQVIVNAASSAPLAGTEPLARLLGTTQLGLGSTQLGRGFVKMTAGGHTSLLRPEGGAPQVTAELQTQVVTFILNNGGVAVGGAAPGNVELPATP